MKPGFCPAMFMAIILCSGCASGPGDSRPAVPPPRVVEANAATIVFFRPTSPPAGVKGTLWLDGVEIGKVFVRRYALLHVNPGRHEIRFTFPFWTAVNDESASLECEPNQNYYISYTSLMSLAALYLPAGTAAFRITPEMKLVAESDARPFMNRFDLAFVYGEKRVDQTPVTVTSAAAAPVASGTAAAPTQK